jgi:hypothetical protein
MPESSQAVAIPVPVPNSSKRLEGFDAASVRKRAPVRGSEAMLNDNAWVRSRIEARAAGGRI